MAQRPALSLPIDDDDDWKGLSIGVSSTLTSTSGSSEPTRLDPSSSSSSGKYNMFNFVGATISGGGPKRSLFHTSSIAKLDKVCLGLVGSNKFCIKSCLEGSNSCGTGRHGSSKFSIAMNCFYIKHSDSQVHCQPVLDGSSLTLLQVEAVLDKTLSASEWSSAFTSILEGVYPDWWPSDVIDEEISTLVHQNNFTLEKLSILSPTRAGDNPSVFDFHPSLSFDSSESSDNPSNLGSRSLVTPTELLVYIESMNRKFHKIRESWSKPFMDIESSYRLLVSDLQTLSDNTNILHSHIGKPTVIKGQPMSTIWEALDKLGQALQEVESANEAIDEAIIVKVSEFLNNNGTYTKTVSGVEDLSDAFSLLNSRVLDMERILTVHTERFKTVKALLQQISVPGQTPDVINSPNGIADIAQRVQCLEQKATGWETTLSQPTISLDVDLSELKEEIRLLKQRVVGSGITIGHHVFQSYEDFALWVKTELPSGRFGLFVDGHSLLDFFSFVGFLDAESVANSFHSSNKSGFKSMLETRVAASMQNFFPAPFGKTAAEKIEDSESLPGIPDPDKFDNGSTGIRYKILRGMKDVSAQLESNIDKVLRDYPDARQMARDLLLNAKRFVIDLLNFMSQDFNSWKLRGYTKKEAWKMTCRSVHRILDDLQGARMTGRDAGDGCEVDRMTATYIWATAKTHEIMDEYLKYQFFEHPAIAAVLARHLAATAVLPDETLSSKVQQLDNKLNKLITKVDSIESKVNFKPKFSDGTVPSPILKQKNGGRGEH
jgi:hypothetical protein